ncbi:hypothetical protein ACEWY4_004336 [Coilia grayii]|uniref:Uncharacterized protein n=1 Tax=Coilia grayii TaxID=363190 RepID=A0ABD1KLD0_9TELE
MSAAVMRAGAPMEPQQNRLYREKIRYKPDCHKKTGFDNMAYFLCHHAGCQMQLCWLRLGRTVSGLRSVGLLRVPAALSSHGSSEFSVFAARSLGRAVTVSEGRALSKAEFMEKVRQSNEACQHGDFQSAVRLYSEALRADPQNCILYSNRSAAHLKLGQYQTALDDAIKARLLNPKWPKHQLA